MKILCDVCNKEESTVFCAADEAALCSGCDERVHGANKLASKHDRHALSHHTSQGSPLCDICQDRRALFFCREDRAISCRECDLRVHAGNKHTRNHNRFLLTGVGVSASASLSSPSSYSLDNAVSDKGTANSTLRSQSPVQTEETETSSEYLGSSSGPVNLQDDEYSSVNSISDYFTKTLPGWRIDDFLDAHPPPQFDGYSKTLDEVFPIFGGRLHKQRFGQIKTPQQSRTRCARGSFTSSNRRRRIRDGSFAFDPSQLVSFQVGHS